MPEVPRSLRVGAIVSVTAQSFVALPCQTRVLRLVYDAGEYAKVVLSKEDCGCSQHRPGI